MTNQKLEQNNNQNASPSSVNDAALPDSSPRALRDAIKKDVSKASADSVEILAGETVLDPQTLKTMFLLGKLTTAQLAHEMKKYNDVAADSLIKEGKNKGNVTSVIEYREVHRANPANPGADMHHGDSENRQSGAPKNAREAKQEAGNSDDPKKKRELEKQEQKLKSDESLTTQRRLSNFTDAQTEQKNRHAEVEMERLKEQDLMRRLMELDPTKSQIEKAQSRNTKSNLRLTLSEEVKKEKEVQGKLLSGPTTGNSK